MGAVTAELAMRQMDDQTIMVPGLGALGVVPPRYVAANDNRAESITITNPGSGWTEPPKSFRPHNGDWIQTFSGRAFWPMDPDIDLIHIEDIAHSLSLQCRYAGHCVRFYSVAEHSVLMAWWLYRHADATTALCGLLHDASEAYLVDVPRPVKPFLAGYKDAESEVMAAISERFDLPPMPRAVKEADDWIIGDELANMKPMAWHARYAGKELGVTLALWEPAEAERRFLLAFKALSEEVRGMEI